MSFHYSAKDIHIEDNHKLVALLADSEGEMQEASIDLNEYIGNNDGSFEWEGQNFSETAEDVEFHIEGDGEVPVLRAKLNNADGEPVDADINLAERIVNDNGEFSFQ
ncbi:CVNH domain-containing protein [Aspergillus melleus]|uniref:CVNH domain-containing protein n=1 Tax=Aspergillus melleus TaxID=138277 RepID=UPI001E8E3E96|nr:uncharacterized protein LDX57_009563 [Aspergillus melleus]KAH8431914.1 hypothetical protein LDX57_009563 [Aspergillus melleus]